MNLVGSVALVTFMSALATGLSRPFGIVGKVVGVFVFAAADLFLGDTLLP
jgi:hypothetical protein